MPFSSIPSEHLNPVNEVKSAFDEKVAMGYQLYNSLFLTLPFEGMDRIGTELPLFSRFAEDRLQKGQSPLSIVQDYFGKDKSDEEVVDTLFRFLQFVERQVVLFDALEEAAFDEVNDAAGPGTLPNLTAKVNSRGKRQELADQLKDYRVRLVLTAHPTQFYPGSVLGIISTLGDAIQKSDLAEIHNLLLQLGKTRFTNRDKPTPFEEARALNWNLINVFFHIIPEMKFRLAKALDDPFSVLGENPLFEIGFWPGGDRDGNPFVTSQTTLDVSRLLKKTVLDGYYQDVRHLKRRLTFDGVLDQLETIQERLFHAFEASLQGEFHDKGYPSADAFLEDLGKLRQELIQNHQSLFLEHLDRLIYKAVSFGFHFAALDMRQDSRVHRDALLSTLKEDESLQSAISSETKEKVLGWQELDDPAKHTLLEELLSLHLKPDLARIQSGEELSCEVLRSISVIPEVQATNGEKGLCRYIISNAQRSSDVLTILLFARWMGLDPEKTPLDVVPLFETIEDLDNAMVIMDALYSTPAYIDHLAHRGNQQTIMLGFSDGTKDGGPIAANWSIHKAKVSLSSISERHGITVHFFDGRGGPPARGGGNTHQYYRAQGEDIQQEQIQLTIQGQTISTKFGSIPSARYNFEELFTASLEEKLFPTNTADKTKRAKEEKLLDEVSELSLETYREFKGHPLFVPYLEEITPLPYISKLNIASRPTRRKSAGPMKFEDLRAIPFVSSWAQMKQNIPGYYGLGAALEKLIGNGRMDDVAWLYRESLFFRTLVENAMQALAKSRMELTTHLSKDDTYGEFWHLIKEEVNRCRAHLKTMSGQKRLMDNVPHIRASIDLREQVVLPLLVIQQYALTRLREEEGLSEGVKNTLEKLVLKALATNINASRNSA